MDPLTKKLAKIALLGAVGTAGFGLVTHNSVKKRIRSLDVYKTAVDDYVLPNKHLKEYLGEPIRVLGPDLSDKFTNLDEETCNIAVNVQGPKSSGILYLHAEKTENDDRKAILKSLEFELKSPKGRMKLL